MWNFIIYLFVYCFSLLSQGTYGKWAEGEIDTLEDWQFITRFCFLSAKGTLRFHFEYPISYGPQNILLYFDSPDQWDAVYKSGKSCYEKVSVLDVYNNQIINLTTSYGLSGCTINNAGFFICDGGRIFRSSRERWWFIAVSHCDRAPSDTCEEKLLPLGPTQDLEMTDLASYSGCVIEDVDGVSSYVCTGGRIFKSSRERWWYMAVSGCEKDTGDTCAQKVSVLDPKNNQVIELTSSNSISGCIIERIGGTDHYVCTGGRRFRSARERWWYVAVSRCDRTSNSPVGIKLKYKIHMTNGDEDDYLHEEYSADEFYIMPIDATFLGVYVLLCAATIICAVMLRMRQLWHTTYKMYMVSVFLWTFHLFLMTVAYGIYGNDGLEWKLRATKYAARAFESISVMVFLLMLILVAKGYTITRGKLSMVSTVKITVFMSLYTIVYVVIFIWEAIIFDPGLVLYLYESPPGYALIAMRIIGYVWFCYAIFFTLKHYPEKGKFYYPMFVFYTLWFWATPVTIFVATFAIPQYMREKVVHGLEVGVAVLGHFFFLVLTRPSAANTNFPYHVRTTQIGILQDVPHQMQTGAPDGTDMDSGSFGAHAYSVSSPMQGSSSGPDLTGLFVTSQTKSSEKQREAETSMSNGYHNGTGSPPPEYNSQPRMVMPSQNPTPRQGQMTARNRMNSTAHLISNAEEENVDEIPDFPVTPSAPPTYEAMFQARPSLSK